MQPYRTSTPPQSSSPGWTVLGPAAGKSRSGKRTWILLFLLAIVSFLLIECFVPLRTAVQIGADEGFELAKATLCGMGHYTRVTQAIHRMARRPGQKLKK